MPGIFGEVRNIDILMSDGLWSLYLKGIKLDRFYYQNAYIYIYLLEIFIIYDGPTLKK